MDNAENKHVGTSFTAYDEQELQESFRNTLYNIDTEGKRHKIYVTPSKGKLTNYRSIVAVLLLAFLFGAPFIKVNDAPFMLFNILERKFILFGFQFWPQDFHLLLLTFLFILISIVLFTSVIGRVWCGWLCPQTIFLEFIFRKIEFWIEGGPVKQYQRDKGSNTFDKIWRKTLKLGIYYIISFFIANIFLSYIIGMDELVQIITDPPSEHIKGLTAIAIFSAIFFGVFARFREQACVIVCPYGRYQSVLVNNDTKAISYDFVRGEPRGKLKRQKTPAPELVQIDIPTVPETKQQGDCIDCGACVRVCPTGIDIRNGIQLECVNCTACIDACDDIMTKVKKPTGLIRYTSLNEIKTGKKQKIFTTRVIAYTAVWLLVVTALTTAMLLRDETETLILRQRGTFYQEMADGSLGNFYEVKIVNKTLKPLTNTELRLLSNPEGKILYIGDISTIPAQKVTQARIVVSLPKSALKGGKTELQFGLFSQGKQIELIKTGFLGPQ